MLHLNISLTPTTTSNTTSTTSNNTLASNIKQNNSELYDLFITILIEKFSKKFIEAGEYFIRHIYDPSLYCNLAYTTTTTTAGGHNSDPTTNTNTNSTPTDGSKISLYTLFKHYEYNIVLYNVLINKLHAIQDQSLKGYILIDIIVNVSYSTYTFLIYTAYFINIQYIIYVCDLQCISTLIYILLYMYMIYYYTYKRTTTFLTPLFPS